MTGPFRVSISLKPPHELGGTRTYKHPLNSMGWANEEQPQTSKESRDGFFTPAELLPLWTLLKQENNIPLDKSYPAGYNNITLYIT